jgi:hypothetical protein
MKRVIISFFVLALLGVSTSSCKKDKVPTLQDKVTGKWLIETYEYNDHFAGIDHRYTMTGTAAEYMDFRNDGKMYYYFGGGHDTLTYSILSQTEMKLDGTLCQIRILTDNKFKFYYREDSGADFEENTITLKR